MVVINSSQSTELYMENDGEIKLVNGQPRYNSGTLIITSQQTYLIFHHLQTRRSQKVSYFFFFKLWHNLHRVKINPFSLHF